MEEILEWITDGDVSAQYPEMRQYYSIDELLCYTLG